MTPLFEDFRNIDSRIYVLHDLIKHVLKDKNLLTNEVREKLVNFPHSLALLEHFANLPDKNKPIEVRGIPAPNAQVEPYAEAMLKFQKSGTTTKLCL
jgi:hypothetical protein